MFVKTYGLTEKCTVQMSRNLARLCRPYTGCPRGSVGCIGFDDKTPEKEQIMEILLESGENVLKGADDDFVCIPRPLYEQMLDLLR